MSKRVDAPYRSGPSMVWLKSKNPASETCKAPGLSLTGFRFADHALGLPVLRTLSLCTCCRHYPGAASGRTASLTSPSRVSLPQKGRRVGLRIVLFEGGAVPRGRVTAGDGGGLDDARMRRAQKHKSRSGRRSR